MKKVFTDRFLTVSVLTEDEANEYRKMTPGISITNDMLRCVAENDEEKQIIEVTANGFNRIMVRKHNQRKPTQTNANQRKKQCVGCASNDAL